MRKDLSLGFWMFGALSLAACSSSGPGDPASSMADQTAGADAGNGGGQDNIDPETGLPLCPEDESQRTERCVDEFGLEICPTDTGYPGDGLAVCTPDSSVGMVMHYGPKDYDNPDEIDKYLLPGGGEDENCTFIRTPNEQDVFVGNYNGRMRPQSHHLIVTTFPEDQFQENPEPGPCNLADSVGARWLVGSQDPQIDVTISGGEAGPDAKMPEPGDPDYGLAQTVAAKTGTRVDMHYVNTTEDEILREAWVHFDYVASEDVENLVDMITFFQGTIKVPPHGTATTARARCVAPTDRYLGLITGHAHETMTRFSVWHEKMDGDQVVDETLVYETFDWADPGNLFYSDRATNPQPNEAAGTFGGASGYQLIKAGDAISFECEYNNPNDHEVTLGATSKDEMCNVFGMYYPTDGDVWNCACAGDVCVDQIPQGIDINSLNN